MSACVSSVLVQFNNFSSKYPPTTESDADSYRMMDLVIGQNMDWMAASENDLSDWLASHLPKSSGLVASLRSSLPISPPVQLDSTVASPGESY